MKQPWLLQWLGDPGFRALHPRVFLHLHGKGAFYARREFRRECILQAAKNITEQVQNVLQVDAVDPTATGFF